VPSVTPAIICMQVKYTSVAITARKPVIGPERKTGAFRRPLLFRQ
jgi:hypothetical protein